MTRLVLLCALVGSACNSRDAHDHDAALFAALFTAGWLAKTVLDICNEHDCIPPRRAPDADDEVDDRGRRAHLIERVRCAGENRSYKRLCVSPGDCYFERNDATIVRCAASTCDEVPRELAGWCRGE
jgi:hypothetical protein